MGDDEPTMTLEEFHAGLVELKERVDATIFEIQAYINTNLPKVSPDKKQPPPPASASVVVRK